MTKVIDATPTWAGILPLLRMGIENANPVGQSVAWDEIARMAEAADKWNERVNLDKMRADFCNGVAVEDIEAGTKAAMQGASIHVNPFDHGGTRACNWLIGFGDYHASKRGNS